MAKRFTTSTARANFSDLISRAQYKGERIVLHRRNKPVAAIVPVEDLKMIEWAEDEIDIRAARRARKEPGSIPLEQVKRELGL